MSLDKNEQILNSMDIEEMSIKEEPCDTFVSYTNLDIFRKRVRVHEKTITIEYSPVESEQESETSSSEELMFNREETRLPHGVKGRFLNVEVMNIKVDNRMITSFNGPIYNTSVNHSTSTVNHSTSTVNHSTSTVNHSTSTVNHSTNTVNKNTAPVDKCLAVHKEESKPVPHAEVPLKTIHKCPYCFKTFEEKSYLDSHEKSHELRLKCIKCKEDFSDSEAVQRHMIEIHSFDRPAFKCQRCDEEFYENIQHAIHKIFHTLKIYSHEDVYKNESSFNCEQCNKDFPDKKCLMIHLRTHPELVFACKDCENTYCIKSSLRNFLFRQTGKLPHTCYECGRNFTENCFLAGHKLTHKGVRRYKCRLCLRDFTVVQQRAPKYLQEICKRAETKIKCQMCESVFSHEKELKKHLKVHNKRTRKQKRRQENTCASVISRSDVLKKNLAVQTLKSEERQEIMSENVFSHKDPLEEEQIEKSDNQIERHENMSENALSCNHPLEEDQMVKTEKESSEIVFESIYCDNDTLEEDQTIKSETEIKSESIFSLNDTLEEDQKEKSETRIKREEIMFESIFCDNVLDEDRTHKSEIQKEFKCELCTSEFTHKYSLKKHLRLHTGEKRYKCKYCDDAFFKLEQLRVHTVSHTGEMPYFCSICNKGFYNPTNLKLHIEAVHIGLRPFPCEYCEKAFFGKGDLNRHMVIHTGARPYFCDLCGNTFSQASSVSKHKRLIHGITK